MTGRNQVHRPSGLIADDRPKQSERSLVSGDQHLHALADRLRIVTARAFLDALAKPRA
jgi:hypothetical protein